MRDNSKTRLAFTMGDAAGVGPEIIVKALAENSVAAICEPLVIGDLGIMREALRFWPGNEKPAVKETADPSASPAAGEILVYQPGKPLKGVKPGVLSEEAGRGAAEYILAAVDLAKRGLIDGMVTAPLNKAALHKANYKYPGHTEMLAEGFGVKVFSLVLSAKGLFCFHVTTHAALRNAVNMITKNRVLAQIKLAHLLATALGKGSETIAVAGLNPHAGENGLFGNEELEAIIPAIEEARRSGITVEGPLPADVLFPRAMHGGYKFVVAMYHDQGHAVFKSFHFHDGVNITVGLPVIRTSVDHGTAFDIAGKGIANHSSLVEAALLAARLGPKWREINAAANKFIVD